MKITGESVTDTRRSADPGRLIVIRAGRDGVVTASGEIGHHSVAELHEALPPGGAPDPGRVVLDMGLVTFMDSSGTTPSSPPTVPVRKPGAGCAW